jgi:cytochrome c
MRTRTITAGAFLLVSAAGAAVAAEGDAKRGAAAYRACVACHSLEAGVHLTGPTLAGLWGKKAASIADYPRYSKALGVQEFIWDETTLNAWLADPAAFVKDNSMTFRGPGTTRRAPISSRFCGWLSPPTAPSVVVKGLLPAQMARGQVPEPLDQAGPEGQVVSVRHCRNTFFVVTADGAERPIWEMNLRLKVDSGANGPKGGKPVLTGSGMQGDRASLVFSDPDQISAF